MTSKKIAGEEQTFTKKIFVYKTVCFDLIPFTGTLINVHGMAELMGKL